MVMRNKFYRIVDKFRDQLVKRYEKKGDGTTLESNRSKNKILDFYFKNNHWPNRRSKNKVEKLLGSRFENYLSKENHCYDPRFRRIVLLTGRKSNNKRKHDYQATKKDILDFIEKYGHVPARYGNPQEIEGEAKLRCNLDRYTQVYGDMSFLGEIYSLDPCHRSGIPMKFRSIINQALDVEKPLFRLV